MAKNEIVKVENKLVETALEGAIDAWTDYTTATTSLRRVDLRRDKSKVVKAFFAFVGKPPDEVTPADVKDWQAELEKRDPPLKPATIYAMVSRVSSFYNWARKDSDIAERIPRNPVDLARPKAPKPYSSESTNALDENDLKALIQIIKAKADTGDLVGKRDYAIILHLALTGRRRAEVLGLTWGDINTNGTMIVRYQVKGADYETYEVRAPIVKESMLDYLRSSERLESMTEDSPIWISHRRSVREAGHPLTSHGFARQLKRYARKAGLGDIRIHQLRHTFAMLYGDESGSMSAVMEALGHSNISTTKVYLQRVGLHKDRASSQLADRLGLNDETSS